MGYIAALGMFAFFSFCISLACFMFATLMTNEDIFGKFRQWTRVLLFVSAAAWFAWLIVMLNSIPMGTA